MDALIAQLDRVSDYGSEGYGFDSYWARQMKIESICFVAYTLYFYAMVYIVRVLNYL